LALDSSVSSRANLKADLNTIGSRCRIAGTEVLSSLVRFVVTMAHRTWTKKRMMELLRWSC